MASESFPPDEAFRLLGNETRIEIMRVLGKARGPMSFTELRTTVGIRQGGQFNYHLDKLVGHFVEKTDEGYALRTAGRRVVEAVLSGAVTEAPVLEPAIIPYECLLCGAPIKLSYRAGRVELYCTECPGQYAPSVKDRESRFREEAGVLGGYPLPPAAIADRSRMEVLAAASLWQHTALLADANGMCPACGARVDRTVTVCESHDRSDGLCPSCAKRHAIQVSGECRNCPHAYAGMAVNYLATTLPLRRFIADQGIDPIVEGYRWGWDYEEEVLATDPLRARLTFACEGARITVTVDENLEFTAIDRET